MTLPDPNVWRGRRVLVTGHTGFMGSWLSLWLVQFGARVTGYALPPAQAEGLFASAGLGDAITSVTGDLKDRTRLRHCIELMRPEIIFHLAGQESIHRAYADPMGTYLTNVVGTAEVLEAARLAPDVQAVVVATSDRVYEMNDGSPRREGDSLGGHNPMSVSKVAAEMAVAAFRNSLTAPAPAVATVRAGGIVGGGDWHDDRLIPNAIRAFRLGVPLELPDPNAVVPCQHVFEPLCGWLLLAERLMTGDQQWRAAWNFGTDTAEPAHHLADRVVELWNSSGVGYASWTPGAENTAEWEIQLDSTQAREALGWQSRLSTSEALSWTFDWYIAQAHGEHMRGTSAAMIDSYMGMSAV